jgi:pSer/pThr/pTyr-binding forkhead associated (FHA) protein
VQAVQCPAGHLNPPDGVVCRVCSAEIADQVTTTVPRPCLGVFRFSSGQTVKVVQPLFVGRSPKVTGQVAGEFPELVTVPSPDHDVSRVHLEVRIEGWRLLAIDSGSTNGTVVTLPGRAPQRLRAGDPFPLSPGAHVSLGGEVTFEYEVEP